MEISIPSEYMVEYLLQNPQLYFTLALIELQVFNLNKADDTKIIIPQLITRTREITRAIVRIEGNQPADFKINIETDLGTELAKQPSQTNNRLTITAQDYFEQLERNTDEETVEFANQIIKDCEELGLFIEWNTSSFGAKLPDPQGSGVKIGIFTVDRTGFVYLGYSKGQLAKLQLPADISYSFAADTAAMLPNIKQHPDIKYVWNKYSTLSALKPVYGQFKDRVKKYIDDITFAGQRAAANREDTGKGSFNFFLQREHRV